MVAPITIPNDGDSASGLPVATSDKKDQPHPCNPTGPAAVACLTPAGNPTRTKRAILNGNNMNMMTTGNGLPQGSSRTAGKIHMHPGMGGNMTVAGNMTGLVPG